MRRVEDERLQALIETRQCDALPGDVAAAAYRFVRLMAASRSWGDLFVFADDIIAQDDGRFAAHVKGKWWIVFIWSDDLGPVSMRIERI